MGLVRLSAGLVNLALFTARRPGDVLGMWQGGGQQIQWIGLRENLQETMVFTIKYRGFL
jgi:hypothetical protein